MGSLWQHKRVFDGKMMICSEPSIFVALAKPRMSLAKGDLLSQTEEKAMQRSGMMIAAALTMASPGIASATAYTFAETETSALGSKAFSFSFDTATAGNSSGGASFSNVTITANGTPTAGQTVTASFTTDLSSGSLFFLVDTGNAGPLYSGTGTGIVFNTGTFAIADGLTDGEGTLTIAAASAAPVPEPATWAVLLGGLAVAAAAGIARRARWSLGSGAAAA